MSKTAAKKADDAIEKASEKLADANIPDEKKRELVTENLLHQNLDEPVPNAPAVPGGPTDNTINQTVEFREKQGKLLEGDEKMATDEAAKDAPKEFAKAEKAAEDLVEAEQDKEEALASGDKGKEGDGGGIDAEATKRHAEAVLKIELDERLNVSGAVLDNTLPNSHIEKNTIQGLKKEEFEHLKGMIQESMKYAAETQAWREAQANGTAPSQEDETGYGLPASESYIVQLKNADNYYPLSVWYSEEDGRAGLAGAQLFTEGLQRECKPRLVKRVTAGDGTVTDTPLD